MTDIIMFIKDYWFLILIGIAVVSVVSIKVYEFFKKPNSEQLRKVQEWLVWAVAKAEDTLGSGTGQLKMKYVYDLFVAKYPAIAIFLSYDQFLEMAEKALDEFKEMMENNEAIKQLYEKEIDVDVDEPGLYYISTEEKEG